MIKRAIKAAMLIVYWFKKIKWVKLFKLYDTNSQNVVLITFISKNYSNEIISWDASALNFFIRNDLRFHIKFRSKMIRESKVIWSPSKHNVSARVKNYTKQLVKIASQIEKYGNDIIPSSKEIKFYENKAFMYEYFMKKDIHCPRTQIFNSAKELFNEKLEYPVILKGEFSSGSKDVNRFKNRNSLMKYLKTAKYQKSSEKLILQEFINLRRDLRVTFVNDEIVLYYWRINHAEEWRPTASSFGSEIDFNNFPKKWEDFILKQFKKLEMKMGALDIAWEGDNLDSKPYVLEFSPRFSPNPSINFEVEGTYSDWKKKLFHSQPFWKIQAKLIEQINFKYIKSSYDHYLLK